MAARAPSVDLSGQQIGDDLRLLERIGEGGMGTVYLAEQITLERRLVVKVGTNVLTRDSGELALGRTHSLIEDVVDVHRAGQQVIVVSSGAVAMGMERLGLPKKPSSLPELQACAAVGQSRLMSVYEQAFGRFGITTAQILLTEDDFADRDRYLNLRNTMERLLADGVIPIVNENDTVSTSEIESLTPEGGDKGGRVVVEGPPEHVAAYEQSYTGQFLRKVLPQGAAS